VKKILLLGGSNFQIPSIVKAKELGYYAITCDYLPNNPGHKYADEYHNVSTTDKEGVLDLAKKLKVDGIVCYASDPGAPTAAYVAEKLGLPSNPYKSVEILTNKSLFRKFLAENGFNTPKAKAYANVLDALNDLPAFRLPVFIKPVDSSGSKGISVLEKTENLRMQAEYAISFSNAGYFIMEEYIENVGYQVGGDGFSVDGQLVFRCFNNQHFGEKSLNPFIPVGISYPCIKPKYIQDKIHNEIQRLFDLLDIRSGAYNFEVRVTADDEIWLVEIGARNGGNLVPQVTRYATGVDMVEYTIKAAMGDDCSMLMMNEVAGCWGNYKVNSQQDGVLQEVVVDSQFMQNNIVQFDMYYTSGDEVPAFSGSNGILGMMISKFEHVNEMLEKMNNMSDYVHVTVRSRGKV